MQIKKCILTDTETLARLNKQLIEDEKSDNPMILAELEYRKKHLGTKAFQLLKEYLKVNALDIEVLSWNEAGMKFWQSLGFCERSRYMRYQGEK